MRWYFLLVYILLTCCVAPNNLSAQDDPAATDTTVVEVELSDPEKAQAYLATVTALLDSLTAIQSEIQGASDEHFQLLRVSGQRHLKKIDEVQPHLLKLLPELDPYDPIAEEVISGSSDYFLRKFEIYVETLNWWSREIDILREKRPEATPEELGDLESQIGHARSRVDDLVLSLEKILENADSLGMDTEDSWSKFDRAVNNRAETLTGRLQVAVEERESLKKKIATIEKARSPEEEIGPVRTRLQYSEDRVKGVAASLGTTVDVLGSRGFETASYRQFIIKTTGQVSDKVLDPLVMIGLLTDALKDLGRWLKNNGPTALVRLMIVVVMVIVTRLAFRLVWWLVRVTRLVRLTKLMVQLGNSMVYPIATIIGLFIGLWFIGANPATLLTGAGVAGVIIGFALQDALSNMAAGFFILATRPFDVDDVIRTGTVTGTVRAMWLANTTIVTFDGRRLLIPNRKIWAEIIENRSVEPLRRVDIVVRVGYDEDIDGAIDILLDLVRKEGRVLDHPEPRVFVTGWKDSWAEVAVRPWTRNEEWWPLMTDLPRMVALRFREEGIKIPYPRMEWAGSESSAPPEPEIPE